MPIPQKYYLLFIVVLIFVFVLFFNNELQVSIEPETVIFKTNSIDYLPPHEHEHSDSLLQASHHEFIKSEVLIAPKDLWVKKLSFSLQNADDTVLHHATLSRKDLISTNCPTVNYKSILRIGEDQMHNPLAVFPEDYALFIPKGSSLFLQVMLHNPKPPVGYGGEYHNVYSEMKLTLASEDEIKKMKPLDSTFLTLSDELCGDAFSVPANTENYVFGSSSPSIITASSYIFPTDSKILYMGAHSHGWEGGKSVDVYINGNLIKTYKTHKFTNNLFRYDTEHGPENINVKAGDQMSITATYDNNFSESLTGAMGVLGIYFAPSN